MLRAALTLLAAASCAFSTGCILYAPIDLGLDQLGKVQEVTLVESKHDERIVLLHVDGEITDEGSEGVGFLGSSQGTTAKVKDVLELAKEDSRVQALVIMINSPGGGVTASDIIYNEVLDWKKATGKPVVALLMDTAASGGFYIAQAADVVIAHPTCVTGSIGVITWIPSLYGLGDKLGVSVTAIKSGAAKDVGSPFRAMTEDDRKILQGMIDQMYARFVEVVAAGRRLPQDQVRKLADGRVYTAREAHALKLVDKIGYWNDALLEARRLAKLSFTPRVVAYERKGFGNGPHTIYSRDVVPPIAASVLSHGEGGGDRPLLKIDAGGLLPSRGPVLKYLWVPSVN